MAVSVARSLLGTREIKGIANNPKIMDWADDLDMWYPGDDTPWCGLFVAHCEATENPNQEWPENRLGARNWLEWGDVHPVSYGAVGVFWRTHKTKSWHGHVGYIVGKDNTSWHVLGGNQSDSVSLTRIAKDRLLGCRLPKGARPDTRPLTNVVEGGLSTNEA